MTFELREYQKNILKELENEFLNETKEIVIAAAPSSGKTVMMIEFMKLHKESSFLILTHGTNILKNQWELELKTHELEASDVFGEKRISFGLPQSAVRRKLPVVDFLIIDEAHEFTHAAMVKEIKNKVKAKHVIYLTGTPSKFIKEGIKIIVVPAIDLIKDGFISDLYIGMVSTTAQITNDDYNNEGNILDSKTLKLEKTVDTDLDQLLTSIHKRLCETGLFKGSPELRRLVEWAPTLGKLHKTMIACRSIKQAQLVEAYFIKNKISVISSNSLNDVNSENIQVFLDDESIKVLVVVDRGILGFNMPDLVNVVDLTCSRNIDRIYQLYARAMRLNSKYTHKYFFKFSDKDNMQLMKFYMNASLMLMFPDFIKKYNGKNLNGCEILVHKPRQRLNNNKTESIKNKGTYLPIDKLFYDTVSVGSLLQDIYNKTDNVNNEYAYVTFGEIKQKEFNYRLHDVEEKIQQIKEFYKVNGKLPNKLDKLYYNMMGYVNENNNMYNKDFRDWCIKREFITRKIISKEELLILASRNFPKPFAKSKNKDTAKLGVALARWLSKDPDFKEKIQNTNWGINMKKRKVICIETNEIFESISDAARQNKVKLSSIYCAIKRNNKSAGYHWKYFDEDDKE